MPSLNLSAYLIICNLLVAGLWAGDHFRANAKYASLERDIAVKRSEAVEDALKTQTKLNESVADLSQKLHEANAKYAQSENARDAAIAAGATRVYVRAKRPSVPENASAPAGVDGSAAELDPIYRSTLSGLRRDAARAAEQIVALQKYARACKEIN